MSRVLARAVSAAVIGALSGAAWLALFYILQPGLVIEFDTNPPRLVRGVHDAEREPGTGRTFAWTQQDMALRLPGLDRSVQWVMSLRLGAGRADARDLPELTFYADGRQLLSLPAPGPFEDVQVTIPASSDRRRGVLVSMRSSSTFVPGPTDQRALGVMVDRVALSAAGVALPPRRAFAGATATGAALGAAVALIGVTSAAAVGSAVVLSAGAAALIARGFGPETAYPLDVATAAAWIGVLLVVFTRVVDSMRREPLRNTARFAAAFTVGALFLKLSVLLHPDMPIGDAMFHAHRFQGVLAGNYYFTSIAPGNYLFPYPPGLYVFATPFAGLVAHGAPHMTLLRIIVLSVDAIAAVLLYPAVARAWSNRVAAAIAVALYHLIPLEFGVVTTGNLTNAFAQSLAVMALAAISAPSVRIARPGSVAILAALLAAAFMSHTSTFPLLFLSTVLAAGLFLWKGNADLRTSGVAVLAAASVAFVVAVVVYYAHFGETYRTELARIGAETATAAPDAGGRGIGQRLATVPYYLELNFGVPALVLAAVGTWRLWITGARDRLTLATAGWALACLLFLAVGMFTPVDMRYYFASIPALAVAGAWGAAYLWSKHGGPRAGALALLSWVLWVAVIRWWDAI